LPPGIDIATSLANIAETPDTRSVFALAAEYARSTARSSSMTLCGESLSRPGVFGRHRRAGDDEQRGCE
jgi:hypothetical protein